MNNFLICCSAILLILVMLCIIRAVKGPRTADRMLAVNAGTTIITAIVAIITVLYGESYFADIAVIYVILSFLAVVVFVRVYLNIYRHKREEAGKE